MNGRLPDLSQLSGRKLHSGKYVRGEKARHIEPKEGQKKVAMEAVY